MASNSFCIIAPYAINVKQKIWCSFRDSNPGPTD